MKVPYFILPYIVGILSNMPLTFYNVRKSRLVSYFVSAVTGFALIQTDIPLKRMVTNFATSLGLFGTIWDFVYNLVIVALR